MNARPRHPTPYHSLARQLQASVIGIPLLLLVLSGAIAFAQHGSGWPEWLDAMLPYGLICMAAALCLLIVSRRILARMRTELHAAAETAELSGREQAAQEANRSRDEFLAALNHELRSPLSAIAASVEVLRRLAINDPRGRQALVVMGRQLDNIKRLLGTLLDVAHVIRGDISLELRPANLLELARNVVTDRSRFVRSEGGVEVSGAETWAQADPARVAQMLDHLLDNARQYGGRHIRVQVSSEPDCAVLTVVDDGEGIREDQLSRLFEPFSAGDGMAKGGLGLGLTLVQRLAALQGGSVQAWSKGRGKGSTFTIRLPLSAEHAPAPAPAPVDSAVPRRRILIVEDQTDTRESLQTVLEMEGHKVAVASDGMEGLAKFRLFDPEIVLVDIGLPGMDGYEWGRKIRSRYGEAGARLVALTGYGQDEDRQKAREAGFDRHLTKPVSYAELQYALQ